MRREETKAVRVGIKMNVEWKRGRGRPKKRRSDTIENDTRAAGGVRVGEWKIETSRTRVANPKKLEGR